MKNFNTFKTILAAGATVLSLQAAAQTQQFSQYWLTPQFNMPTAIGVSDYQQISAHYRRQSIAEDLGFTTYALSGQLPIFSGERKIGVAGLSLIRETSGNLNLLATTGVQAGYTHNVSLSSNHFLLGGVQAGYFSRSLNWDDVTTDTQWQFGQYIGGETGENFQNGRSGLFQVNVGLGYLFTNAKQQPILELGVGGSNVNRGSFTYLENNDNEAEPLTLSAYANWTALNTESFSLSPMVRWQQQESVNEYMGGLMFRKAFSGETIEENHLGIGAFYSPEKTTVLALQYAQPKFLLGISYDLATGENLNSRTRNAVEVSFALRLNKRPKQANMNAVDTQEEPPAPVAPPKPSASGTTTNTPVSPKPEPYKPQPLTSEEKEAFKPTFTYEAGSSELSPKEKEQLDEMAKVLMSHPDKKVMITGHTSAFDEKDDAQYKLSQARINNAKAYLQKQGVQEQQVELINRGYEQPIAGNNTEAGRKQNRRITFEVSQ